jgi:CRISPR-associated protein Cas2
MSLTTTTGWVVCYDIADRKRLLRVHRLLRKWGVPMQYSVFIVEASAIRLQRLLLQIDDLIDPGADDVRAYRFPPGSECKVIGPGMLPDGILIAGSSREHDGNDPPARRRERALA